jgi:hypothetical protein
MKLRFLIFSYSLLLTAVYFAVSAAAVQAGENQNLTVMELFTSEGCNSCPPADQYLNDLAARPDVLALSWFVDYWNYLGWTDTFGRKEYTGRQRQYNRSLGLAGVYTPQMIINGNIQEVGSHLKSIEAKIKLARRSPLNSSLVSLGAGKGQIFVNLSAHDLKGTASVRLIGFKAEADVAIRGGELKGLTMHYSNIVTYSRKLGDWNGKPQNYAQAASALTAAGADHYAVLVQTGDTGPILAAATAGLGK